MQTLAPIIAVAAGSAGHILPSITIAQTYAYEQQRPVWLITGDAALEKKAVLSLPLARIEHKYIEQVPYAKPWRLIIFLYQMLCVFFDCLKLFKQVKPQKIVSTGGYHSIPVFCAAKMSGIPTELWSLDLVPGKTVKLLQYIADTVIICFPQTAQKLSVKTHVRPYPVRFKKSDIIERSIALEKLQLNVHKKTVMILGGSKGSRLFNQLIERLITTYHDALSDYQFIHQTGFDDESRMIALYAKYHFPAYVFSYSQQMPVLLSAADIVICRSGAGSLAETAFFEKQLITIPLEAKTTCHQIDNAYAAQQMRPNMVTVLREQDADAESLLDVMRNYFSLKLRQNRSS